MKKLALVFVLISLLMFGLTSMSALVGCGDSAQQSKGQVKRPAGKQQGKHAAPGGGEPEDEEMMEEEPEEEQMEEEEMEEEEMEEEEMEEEEMEEEEMEEEAEPEEEQFEEAEPEEEQFEEAEPEEEQFD